MTRVAGHVPGIHPAGEPGGASALAHLLEQRPDLAAGFVANDLMTAGALAVLRAVGRHVPEDIAVVGFDDLEIARHTEPPLTTVHQPVAEEAREMTREVLRQIGGQPPGDPVIMTPHLVVRASA